MLSCRGKLQKESGVIHVIADEITDLSGLLRGVGDETRAMRPPTRDFR
jgi:error-prone DNA polymerase